jgi:hypothetical protein
VTGVTPDTAGAVAIVVLEFAAAETCGVDVLVGPGERFGGCGWEVGGRVVEGAGLVVGCVTGLGAKAPAISEPSPSF